jgi:hypothetical protein
MPSTETMTRHPQPSTARSPSKNECPCADIALEDWDLMLDAVTARLRTHSDAHQAVMLECAAALEQLHAALRQARTRHQPCGYVFFDHGGDASP